MSEPDRIERLVGQWAAVRPDLDLDTMALAARVMRFALRRAGPPYRLSPSRLAESLLVTSGTMTNRLDRLEERGFIKRIPNPTDRRGLEVELSE